MKLEKILTDKERNKINKELYETLKNVNNRKLRKRQKQILLMQLINQNNILAKKEQYMHDNYNDLEYHGIKDKAYTEYH